jgi:5-methylcytosine-specific restriction endonuclease McrA
MSASPHFEINAENFLTLEETKRLSDSELGRFMRHVNARCLSRDFAYLRSLRWVGRVWNPSGKRDHISLSVRRSVLAERKCRLCDATDRLEVDHIVALANGGTNDRSNLQPLCITCNRKKGTR